MDDQTVEIKQMRMSTSVADVGCESFDVEVGMSVCHRCVDGLNLRTYPTSQNITEG